MVFTSVAATLLAVTSPISADDEASCDMIERTASLVMTARQMGARNVNDVWGSDLKGKHPQEAREAVMQMTREMLAKAVAVAVPLSEKEKEEQVSVFAETYRKECVEHFRRDKEPAPSRQELYRRLCLSIGIRAEQVMLARQRGVAIRTQMEEAAKIPDTGPPQKLMKSLLYRLIDKAYRLPVKTSLIEQRRSTVEFGNQATLECNDDLLRSP